MLISTEDEYIATNPNNTIPLLAMLAKNLR